MSRKGSIGPKKDPKIEQRTLSRQPSKARCEGAAGDGNGGAGREGPRDDQLVIGLEAARKGQGEGRRVDNADVDGRTPNNGAAPNDDEGRGDGALLSAAHSHRVMVTAGPTAGPKLVVNFDPLPHSSWAAKAAREAADTISAAMMRFFMVVERSELDGGLTL